MSEQREILFRGIRTINGNIHDKKID